MVSTTTRSVKDAQGNLVAAVGVMRDVTQARRDQALLARQSEELRVQSLVDELTGLYNRRGFLLLAEQHARTAARTNRPFAILFADLNELKVINDTLGHEAGDHAIRQMSEILKTAARESDIVARLGGDEYVALLDGVDKTGVDSFANRLLNDVAHSKPVGSHTKLSVSIGTAFFNPEHPIEIQTLIAIADQSMYAEKKKSARSAQLQV